MKGISYLAVVLFLISDISDVIAQQLPLHSQYLWNDYAINPAVAGAKEGVPVFLSSRRQWAGMEGAPITQIAGIHGALNKKVGLGVLLTADKTGPTKRTSFQLAYSCRLKIAARYNISFGLAPIMMMYSIKKSELLFDQPDAFAERLSGESLVIDATAGMCISIGKSFAGLAIPQLLENRIWEGDRATYARLKRHYLMYGGYIYKLNEKFEIQPSLYLKYEVGAPFQEDINVRCTYANFVWMGLSYRTSISKSFSEAFVTMIGVSKLNIKAGYAFDYSFGKLFKNSVGSHEIFISYTILKRDKAAVEGK